MGNPNFTAMFLAVLAPLGLWGLGQAGTKGAKIYYSLNILVLITTVIVLGSRGAWLGLVIELVLMFAAALLFRLDRKIILLSLTCLVIFTGLWLLVASPAKTQLAGRKLSLNETNVNLRFAVWDIAEQAIIKHPLTGVGPGNFQIYFEQQRDKSLGNQNGVYDDAHNWFLQIGATVGIPFLLLNLILIFSGLFIGFKAFLARRDILSLSLVMSLIGFCLMAAFTPLSVGCYFLLAVILAGLFFENAKDITFKFPRPLVWLGGLVGVAIVVWGLIFFLSEIIFLQGYNAYFANNYQQSLNLLNWAIKLNPTNRMYYIYRAGDIMRLGKGDEELQASVNKFILLHANDADVYSAASTIYFTRYLDVTHNNLDLTRSVNYMQQSLALDHNRASRNVQMAVYLFTSNRMAEALDYDIYALSLDPDSIPGWLLEARLIQIKGNKQGTLGALESALRISPDNELVRTN